MSDSERKTKERDLSNLNRDLARQGREFREISTCAATKNWGRFRSVHAGNPGNRARRKFDLIVEQAVFVDPKSDITERVMKALGGKNKRQRE